MSLTITGLHVIQRSSHYVSQCICEENCTLKSSFQIHIPISCKSTFFDKNETKSSVWGGNRHNMANLKFYVPVYIINSGHFKDFEAQGRNTVHTDLLNFTLNSIKILKRISHHIFPLTEVILLQSRNKGSSYADLKMRDYMTVRHSAKK